MKRKVWEIQKNLPAGRQVKKLNDVSDILLNNRGLRTKKQKEEFFSPTSSQELSLKDVGLKSQDIQKALARIKKAVKNREKIVIYGDYDADGICGTAILWECLWKLKADVFPYIPDRFTEGYGLKPKAVDTLKKKYPDLSLIVTVDNGIVALEGVGRANELGIEVIITDHHQPERKKPKAEVLLHTTEIGGAALAWIFAREIRRAFKKNNAVNFGLALAAIGTIADQLSLVGPNRSIAKFGLEKLRKTKRVGLVSMINNAKVQQDLVGTYEVGFILAPRINAMGRLKHGIDSLRLLCTTSTDRANDLAQLLNNTNFERQKTVQEVVDHALNAAKKKKWKGVVVLADDSYHEGVIGLAASRLVDEFYLPAIVISTKGEVGKASARSISGFNIIEAIRETKELLLEYGGHPMAAGFSIDKKNIEKFSKAINKIGFSKLKEEILTRKLKIDLELSFKDINWDLVALVKKFDPTGLGNPNPVFATKSVSVVNSRTVGKEGKHLKLKLSEDDTFF